MHGAPFPGTSSYILGRHLVPVEGGGTQDDGAEGRCRMVEAGSLVLEAAPFTALEHAPLPDIPGAFLLKNILSPMECAQLILLAEPGFHEDGHQQQRSRFLVDESLNSSFFARVQSLLPQHCLDGDLYGIDRLWCVDRFDAGAPAVTCLQGSHSESLLVGDGRRNTAVMAGEESVSLASLVIHLNSNVRGGEFRFWIPNQKIDDLEIKEMTPEQGNGVYFFHGSHPLSLIHEDGGVTRGTKYTLRLRVLYTTSHRGEESAEYKESLEKWPHIHAGRVKWEQFQWPQQMKGGIPLGRLGAALHALLAGGMGGQLPFNVAGMSPEHLAAALRMTQGGQPPGPGFPGFLPGMPGAPQIHPSMNGGYNGGPAAPRGSAGKYAVGDIVEAYWHDEDQWFPAKVRGIQNDLITVDWVDWEGVIQIPSSQVRHQQVGSSASNGDGKVELQDVRARRQKPTGWTTVD
eukprot:gnl/MRDRNA2_/MRDRNA2_133176_c0_seq1.p1 gnl/MRDRNA2_/MRDRNA2_133176_c0~~gnl/MRDRNA2_/MRDRNA2_133176_c0_seq1.p1  ORF type:complete len:459 (-),score=71.84 gnl/MRDRNA2_/MRDRNA2_133176_c0_seq1:47-1423(-)